jgi:hypothetical protein
MMIGTSYYEIKKMKISITNSNVFFDVKWRTSNFDRFCGRAERRREQRRRRRRRSGRDTSTLRDS